MEKLVPDVVHTARVAAGTVLRDASVVQELVPELVQDVVITVG